MDDSAYLEQLKIAGERIADVARGNLDAPVPSCPGNTVGSLLIHTAGVCMFWADALVQNRRPKSDWRSFPTDPLEAHVTMHGRVVDELEARDPDQPTWTWEGEGGRVRFAYRRLAQELAVHRWDFENAVGEPGSIDAELALDGIDELLMLFGPASGDSNFPGASERFGGNGETFRLDATDADRVITFAALPNRFELIDGNADVTARGSASDLLLFLWGRVAPTAFEVDGDAALLDRWQERVKI